MTSHYLLWDSKQGCYIRATRLPRRKLTPPEPHEIKWEVRGWPDYCFDCRKVLWHRPYTTQHGRRRTWQPVRKVVKNKYAGYTLRKDGKPYWVSIRQLRPHLIKINTP